MDRETVIAGPWLASPGLRHAAVARSVAAARDAGQGVFWMLDQGEEVVFRHLRKLNAARMPDGHVVYFRHYDSDVIAAIIPLLDEAQAAQLFGPASVIGLVGGGGDGGTVAKPNALPEPRGGPIEFASWQVDLLNDRQTNISHQKIATMLRDSFPNKTRNLSDTELDKLVKQIDKEASSHRLKHRGKLIEEEAPQRWHVAVDHGGREIIGLDQDHTPSFATSCDRQFRWRDNA